ncbi:MAG: hypothetical protein ABEI77_08375 [Halorientalis sp.]
MSPTLSELQDVLDWEAIVVLQTLDDRDGTIVETVARETNIDRTVVENRIQQLDTLGLITEVDAESGAFYEITGAGHGAIGDGLYDEYDLVGQPDLDELAEQVAGLLDRRDELQAQLATLREDAEEVQTRAERQFGDREDVRAEFESLLADIEQLTDRLSES